MCNFERRGAGRCRICAHYQAETEHYGLCTKRHYFDRWANRDFPYVCLPNDACHHWEAQGQLNLLNQAR